MPFTAVVRGKVLFGGPFSHHVVYGGGGTALAVEGQLRGGRCCGSLGLAPSVHAREVGACHLPVTTGRKGQTVIYGGWRSFQIAAAADFRVGDGTQLGPAPRLLWH